MVHKNTLERLSIVLSPKIPFFTLNTSPNKLSYGEVPWSDQSRRVLNVYWGAGWILIEYNTPSGNYTAFYDELMKTNGHAIHNAPRPKREEDLLMVLPDFGHFLG